MTAAFPAASLLPEDTAPLVLALPKGRILAECGNLLARAGIHPAADYLDENSRRLRFPTEDAGLDVVRVRPFDVATFVAFGGGANRHLRRGCADGVRLSRTLRALGPRDWPLPGQRCRARGLDADGGDPAVVAGFRWRPNTPISPAAISPPAASMPTWFT